MLCLEGPLSASPDRLGLGPSSDLCVLSSPAVSQAWSWLWRWVQWPLPIAGKMEGPRNYLAKLTLWVSYQPNPKSFAFWPFPFQWNDILLQGLTEALATWDGGGFGERQFLTISVLVTSVKPKLLELIAWWTALPGMALSEKKSCSVGSKRSGCSRVKNHTS